MNPKTKVVAVFASIVAFFSGLGILASCFLCPCYLAPIFSILGFGTISLGFILNNKLPFAFIGIALLLISFNLYSKKVCKVHKHAKKKKNEPKNTNTN